MKNGAKENKRKRAKESKNVVERDRPWASITFLHALAHSWYACNYATSVLFISK